MVTVVCLSPSMDETITLTGLTVGGTNRACGKRICAGGKGVNVARMLRRMGEDVRLALFRHEQGARMLFDCLEAEGISCIAVDVPGTLRTNIKLFDTASNTVTEINASAEPVPQEAMQRMEDMIIASAMESRWLVLTGSMPKGYPKDAYARIIRRVREVAPLCRIALDAEGEALRFGVEEAPDVIKPNRYELELFMGHALRSDAEIAAAAKSLVLSGVGTVIVSMGTDGAMMAAKGQELYAQAIPVQVATTVGAGDALLSGYISRSEAGEAEAFAYGVAAAAARVAGRDAEADAYLPLVKWK